MNRFIVISVIAGAFALGAFAQTGTKPAPKPTNPPAAAAPVPESSKHSTDAKKSADHSKPAEKPAPKPTH